MHLLPKDRRARAALAVGLAALLASGVYEYRPWEQPRYRGRPASWWAAECRRLDWGWWGSSGGRHCPIRVRRLAPWEEWLERAGVPLPTSRAADPLFEGDPDAVPVLLELLGHPEAEARQAGAAGLSCTGPAGRGAVPSLLAALADPDYKVRPFVEYALERIDPDALATYNRDHPGPVAASEE